MPYVLYKTDGTVLTTVKDAGLDTTTNLQFVGRNYSGYGQVQNENFLKLLENFSNTSAPSKPVKGQVWFDSNTKTLRYSYNGRDFKGLANIFVQNEAPLVSALNVGDLWWDTSSAQLKLYDGTAFPIIGPISAATRKAYWSPDILNTENYADLPILKSTLDNNVVAVVSYRDFTATNPSELFSNGFTTVKSGISLPGADSQGKTESFGYLFWGTASHSRYSNTATYAVSAGTSTNVAITDVGSNDANYFLTFVSTASNSQSIYTSGNIFYNPSTDVLNATATAVFNADLAERYAADAVYDEGTVLVIGGDKEVTVGREYGSTAVAGIVSKHPAYMMNAEAGTDETHPYIALKGRVPCKVIGPISKGDLLVASAEPGYAQVYDWENHHPSAIIGKALESFEGSRGVIEVKV